MEKSVYEGAGSAFRGLGEGIAKAKTEHKDVELLDIGDIDAVKFKGGLIVGFPKGKDTLYLVRFGNLLKPTTIEKLDDVLASGGN